MSRNKNLFKLFLTLGALTTTCFFLNASATDAGTAVEVAGMDVDLSKLDVQGLKDANLNNSKPFDRAAYEEAIKTNDYKEFFSYNVPIKFNENAKALANRVVWAYLGRYIINAIQQNPNIREFLKIKERYTEAAPDDLFDSIGDGLARDMGSSGCYRFFVFDSKKQTGEYLKCCTQPNNLEIYTNKVVADSIGSILNFYKENPAQLKKLLKSITPEELKEYAKSTVNTMIKNRKDWDNFEKTKTIEDYIKDIRFEEENSLKCAKKTIKDISDEGAYIKLLEKRLKTAKSRNNTCRDWYSIRLESLKSMKKELKELIKADSKNAEEINKILRKIDKEIERDVEERKNRKYEEGNSKYVKKLENALKDEKARKEMYADELKRTKEWAKSCEDLLNNPEKIKEIAAKRLEQSKKYSAESVKDIKSFEAQITDIDELSDEDLLAAKNGVEITDGGVVKTYPDSEGWVPVYLQQEEEQE